MNYGKEGTKKEARRIQAHGPKLIQKLKVIIYDVILIGAFALVVGLGFLGLGIYKGVLDSAPSIAAMDATPTGYLSTVLDTEGNTTATLVAQGANRVYVTIDEIPDDLEHAFVAIEDMRFYEHNGIDIKGIIRAGVKGITSGSFSEGASTITQQLLKNNVFVNWTKEKSFFEKVIRKIQEQYLAVELEKKVDKDWILENYMNTINLGQGTLGVQAAARRYFGKDVSELTLSECTVIAVITQNPSAHNPISHPESNAERREKTLNNMLELEFISQEEYDKAMADNVYKRIQKVNKKTMETQSVNSYFVDALTDQVIDDLVTIKGYNEAAAYKALYSGGLTIYSTQDPAIQAICDEEINNQENYPREPEYSFSYALTIEKADGTFANYDEQTMLSYYQSANKDYSINFPTKEDAQAAIDAYKEEIMEPGDKIVPNGEYVTFTLQPQTAMTVIDQHTGEVKAIVGGRGDKIASRTLNRATNTTRQPGSTFKILAAFAPALDAAGMNLCSVQDDAPYSYANGTSLRNYDNSFKGFTTIRQAITSSINIVTVKTLTDVGVENAFTYLENMGFTTLGDSDKVQSLALGGLTRGVTNLELTAAYAAIANGGTYVKPRLYTKIVDHDGKVLIDNTPQTRTVLKETTAWLLTNAMQDVVTKGTGTMAAFPGMAIAGKTGTTTKNRDSLFAGFTPYYTCVVWGGFDDNTPQDSGSYSYSKHIWRSAMQRLHEGLENPNFTKPEGIVTAAVCKKSGKLAVSGVCDHDPRGSQVYTEYFASGNQPTEHCDVHVELSVCSKSKKPVSPYCPEEKIESAVFMRKGTAGTADAEYMLPGALADKTENEDGTTLATTNICDVHDADSRRDEEDEVHIHGDVEDNDESGAEDEAPSREDDDAFETLLDPSMFE